ncbi:hypothetical protein D3C86_1200420 [compost metagenome]
MLAGPGRLDGGVERQEVGLLGDVVDHLDDGPDLLGAIAELRDLGAHLTDHLRDRLHALDGLVHRALSLARGPGRAGSRLVDLGEVARDLLDRGRHLGDGRRRLLGGGGETLRVARHLADRGRHLGDGAGGLLDPLGHGLGVLRDLVDGDGHLAHVTGRLLGGGRLGAGRGGELGAGRADLLRAARDHVRRHPDLADDAAELPHHLAEALGHVADLVGRLHRDPHIEPTTGDRLGGLPQRPQVPGEAAAHVEGHPDGHEDRKTADPQEDEVGALVLGLDPLPGAVDDPARLLVHLGKRRAEVVHEGLALAQVGAGLLDAALAPVRDHLGEEGLDLLDLGASLGNQALQGGIAVALLVKGRKQRLQVGVPMVVGLQQALVVRDQVAAHPGLHVQHLGEDLAGRVAHGDRVVDDQARLLGELVDALVPGEPDEGHQDQRARETEHQLAKDGPTHVRVSSFHPRSRARRVDGIATCQQINTIFLKSSD